MLHVGNGKNERFSNVLKDILIRIKLTLTGVLAVVIYEVTTTPMENVYLTPPQLTQTFDAYLKADVFLVSIW